MKELRQSEISKDNTKVSTFLHSNMLVAVVVFYSYLDRFSKR